ncbi:hypothetical protein [Pseudoalteromonas sp. GB56]
MKELITVNSQYTRSINLERDHSSGSTVASYIPTSRSKRLFERLVASFDNDTHPRAWSLIGPYGSGKSSFSVFLSHLLGNPSSKTSKSAFDVLNANDVEQAEAYAKHVADTSGYIQILISGSPEPLGQRVLTGLKNATENYYQGRRGKTPAIVEEIRQAEVEGTSSSQLVKLIEKLQNEIQKSSGMKAKGILLVIDELGKFLEYEARHYGANDVFLLQELAEHACKGHECNLLMFVLLHQSFEQYAKGLGEALKNEWSKVQGRFEEVPFLESSEQTLKVVAKAIVNQIDEKNFETTRTRIAEITQVLAECEALPSVINKEEAQTLFIQCYPLHPISALILPHLCQKLAQNERTLFNFLGSAEEFGFLSTLKHLREGEFITPDVIFDYFITNQSSVVSDHLTHRRWAEVVTAIERLGAAEESVSRLLKTIGLFNIINAKGNFKAQQALLETIAPQSTRLDIAALTQKSIITYRTFNNEYRVWQGSDFDLEDALQEQLNVLGNFSLSQELNEAQILKPLVARKYTVENGTIRYFVPRFIDAATYKSEAKFKPTAPRIIFFLAYAQDDIKLFEQKVVNAFHKTDIVVLCRNSVQLKDAFAEVIALRKVEQESQALKEDPVAKREYFDRRSAAEASAIRLIKAFELEPEECEWYFDKTRHPVHSRRELQSVLSSVLEAIYSKAPSFHNELINRDKPSSQASAGRNKLLYGMLEKADKAEFDIKKFPPEKAMYLSIVKQHGLHQQVGDKWQLSAPCRNSNIYPTWKRILKFFDSTQGGNAKTFEELDAILIAPPYGVKVGMLPILYVQALLVHQHELAVFEDGVYIPSLTQESIERFVRAPQFFKIESFKIEGLRASIFEGYKDALYGDVEQEQSLLNIARPLAKFIGALEPYTKKTRSDELDKKAQRLVKAFEVAKSPQKLLFEALPKALGFDERALEGDNSETLKAFSSVLRQTLTELKYHYQKMLDHELQLLCYAFGLSKDSSTAQLRKHLAHYVGLDEYSVDTDGLKAFIKRIISERDSDQVWLESVLTFLAAKPPKEWVDADRSKAEFNLSDYSKRISELELLRLEHDSKRKHHEGDFDVVLLKTLRKGVNPREKAVAIDDAKRDSIKRLKQQIEQDLEGLDDNTKLVLFAELVDGFLEQIQPASAQGK